MKMMKTIVLFCAFFTSACATRNSAGRDYREAIHRHQSVIQTDAHSKPIVVFILIDGLQISTLQELFEHGELPSIRRYFLENGNTFFRATTTFPSMTFPAITSLLTTSTMDQHGITGNQIVVDGDKVNFEKPSSYSALNTIIKNKTIFSRLRENGYRTASFDYAFHDNASVSLHSDMKAALEARNKNYWYVDRKIADSFNNLLDTTSVENWPEFVFIHFVGLDFTSHDDGPDATSTLNYLRKLDGLVGEFFQRLDLAEESQKRHIVGFLCSDHGFDIPTRHTAYLAEKIKRKNNRVKAVDEGRTLDIYFPKSWNDSERRNFLFELSNEPGVEILAMREQDHILIQTPTQQISVNSIQPLAGPEMQKLDTLIYPRFISNLSIYFSATTHADAIAIAQPGFSFNSQYRGNHGGPTEREVYVPLLMHNATLTNKERVPAIWELLDFMF
jgi:hypothetical protein